MARAYTIGTAALTLGASVKWLDNVLSHHQFLGIDIKRQGLARHLSIEVILTLAVVLILIQDVGLPTPAAIRLAETLVRTGGRFQSPDGVSIGLELTPLRDNLLQRLEAAVETAPIPRRGRPRTNKTGRLD